MKIARDHQAFDLIGIVSAMIFLETFGSFVSAVALGMMICRAITLWADSDDD